MTTTELLGARITEGLWLLLQRVPTSRETPAPDPAARSAQLTTEAATRAALVSTTLALPPPPAGLVTLVPDLLAVWRLQQQLLVDLAAVHDRGAEVHAEHVLWCLFGHLGIPELDALAEHTAVDTHLRPLQPDLLPAVLKSAGLRLGQVLAVKAASRLVPVLGAGVAGALAWRDTRRVGQRAEELFRTVGVEPAVRPGPEPVPGPGPGPGPGPEPEAEEPALPLPRDGSVIALQAPDDRHVYADLAHDGTLIAAGAVQGPWPFRTWEQFRWHDLGPGRVALQALTGQAYVRVGTDGLLRAQAPDRSEATVLQAVGHPDGTLTLREEHGEGVAMEPGDVPRLRIGGQAVRWRVHLVAPEAHGKVGPA